MAYVGLIKMKINDLFEAPLPGVKQSWLSRMFGSNKQSNNNQDIENARRAKFIANGTKHWLKSVKMLQAANKINRNTPASQYANFFGYWASRALNVKDNSSELAKIVKQLAIDVENDGKTTAPIQKAIGQIVDISMNRANKQQAVPPPGTAPMAPRVKKPQAEPTQRQPVDTTVSQQMAKPAAQPMNTTGQATAQPQQQQKPGNVNVTTNYGQVPAAPQAAPQTQQAAPAPKAAPRQAKPKAKPVNTKPVRQAKPETISINGEKIRSNDPRYAGLMKAAKAAGKKK